MLSYSVASKRRHLLGFVLGIFGKRVLGGALEKSVKAIEADNYRGARKEQSVKSTLRRCFNPDLLARVCYASLQRSSIRFVQAYGPKMTVKDYYQAKRGLVQLRSLERDA